MLRVKYSSQSFVVVDTTSQALTHNRNNHLTRPFEIMINILLQQRQQDRAKIKKLEFLVNEYREMATRTGNLIETLTNG